MCSPTSGQAHPKLLSVLPWWRFAASGSALQFKRGPGLEILDGGIVLAVFEVGDTFVEQVASLKFVASRTCRHHDRQHRERKTAASDSNR